MIMSEKEKILICWNDSEYIRKIEKELKNGGYAVELFCDKDSLSMITQKANYIIILCELLWSNEKESASLYSEMNGIKLGQYLRSQKEIKIPILFVSFLSQKAILDIQPDADIISTPALKHGFVQLPENKKEWIEKLNDIIINKELKKAAINEVRDIDCISIEMSKLDMLYTKRRFCGIVGLLEQINHDVNSCWEKRALSEKWRKLQHANKSIHFLFKTEMELLQKKIKELPDKRSDSSKKVYMEVHKEFSGICQEILKHIEQSQTVEMSAKESYNVLYLEDEHLEDNRVKRLIEIMNKQNFLTEPISKPIYSEKGLSKEHKFNFDAVICDIEIWQEINGNRELTDLGYNYIQYLNKTYRRPVYIILSNVTRSFHNSILNNLKMQVNTFSKSDILSSDSTMQVFIDGIRNLIELKRGIGENNDIPSRGNSNFLESFKYLIDYIYIPSDRYPNPIIIQKKDRTYKSSKDVETFIRQKCCELLEIFEERYEQRCGIGEKFLSDKIKGFGELGKSNIHLNEDKIREKGHANIDKFIKVLIARRLLLYAMIKYDIADSHKLFTTTNNKIFLQHELLFSTKNKKKHIWDDRKNCIQGNCANFLTRQEINFIEEFMRK